MGKPSFVQQELEEHQLLKRRKIDNGLDEWLVDMLFFDINSGVTTKFNLKTLEIMENWRVDKSSEGEDQVRIAVGFGRFGLEYFQPERALQKIPIYHQVERKPSAFRA
jgi:hypothetical protein